MKYFEREWELVGEFENIKKLVSNRVTIFVNPEDIIKI